MSQLPKSPDETRTKVFNPDNEDFVFVYDQKSYVWPSQEIKVYPKYLADHGANKLAEKLVWKRGIITNYEDTKRAILKEIYA